ncbi:MAG: ATP-dependent Clp protease ATP-binding subunit, partial [Candidatus Magasanikbacteria bacterium]|nr:ATP-dependent Clp protease ATP-binding subunit [Candidatus Magasanikbacteria bacterium]
MNIIDRFSTHLRDVLARSIQLSAELKNPEVQPIHLFFTLSTQKGSVAAEIINRLKMSVKTLEQAVLSLPVISEITAPAPGATAQAILTPLATATKTCLEKAMIIAQENEHAYIGTEHLLAALIQLSDPLIDDVLKVNMVKISELQRQLDTVLGNASQFPRINEVAEVVERIQDNLGDAFGNEQHSHSHEHKKTSPSKKKETALDFFAINLTSVAAQKNIDPVIGRDKEIERVIHILCRRTKNNPLLLGDPGVGKTAIVEGLAKRIIQGSVPDLLLNKKIYSLDMGLLIAGTMYRGEFEGRLRQLIEEVTTRPDIILFIDEIHNIVGAGSNQGTMDAANLLKPALARGTIRCIGATTPGEYKKYLESDPALERRFQAVIAREPSLADSEKILEGIKFNYETYHQVNITSGAVAAAVRLADCYITNKFLPDKAIDLLDETAAAKRLTVKNSLLTNKLWRLEQKLDSTIEAKEAAAGADDFKAAVKHKETEGELRTAITTARSIIAREKPTFVGTVTEHDVVAQIAKMTGTAPSELILENTNGLDHLSDRLAESVVGQPQAIATVSKFIRKAQLGLSNSERPLASFLFVGESGVGKTELAKTLAKVLYPNKDALIKLDMSEFNESYSVSKLLGSPAGYVGYKDSNQFTDKIKLNPYCVVVFDEIDKAHKDVTRLLLQMLENGNITDAAGKKISLRHAIIILTTSLGADEAKKGLVGFGNSERSANEQEDHLKEALKKFFSPEIINRLDAVLYFKHLATSDLVAIAERELNALNERLKTYHTRVAAQGATLSALIANLKPADQSAREIRRIITNEVESLVA